MIVCIFIEDYFLFSNILCIFVLLIQIINNLKYKIMSDITLYKVKTDRGFFIVNAIDEVEARSLMEKNGEYVHTCDKIIIKENDIIPYNLFDSCIKY